MSLLLIKPIEGNSILGIWEMDEELEQIAHHYSLPEFKSNTASVISLKRKKELVASRLLLDAMFPGSEINYHPNGKPYLNNDCYISIAHSKDRVCILLNPDRPVGIDVEFITPKIKQVKEKFMSDEELSAIDIANEIEVLLIHWCAKEAMYKYLGRERVIFKTELRVHPFQFEPKGKIYCSAVSDSIEKMMLYYEADSNYMMAYTID